MLHPALPGACGCSIPRGRLAAPSCPRTSSVSPHSLPVAAAAEPGDSRATACPAALGFTIPPLRIYLYPGGSAVTTCHIWPLVPRAAVPWAAVLAVPSADAGAAVRRGAGLGSGGPPALFGALLQHVRAVGTESSLQCVPGASRCPTPWGTPVPQGPPAPGGCDHICGDTCADYGKWVNLPAAGGGLAGGSSWQGPPRGRVRPPWPPVSPLSPGCRGSDKGHGKGTWQRRPPARPQPARWVAVAAAPSGLAPPGTSIRSVLPEPARAGDTVPPNPGVRGCRAAARPPGPHAPCPERPRASCTCLPAVAEPARAVWGRAVPGTPFPGRRLPPQPRLKTTGTAASGCRGTIPLLPGSPGELGWGTPGPRALGLWFPAFILRAGIQGGDWAVPGDVPSVGRQWWLWCVPRVLWGQPAV